MDESEKLRREAFKENSKQISETVKYVGFGLLAIFYALLISESRELKEILSENYKTYILIGISGVFTIIFDYLHYLCGYLSADAAIKRGKIENNFQYRSSWIVFRLWTIFFWVKQCFAAIGVSLLGILILSSVQI